MEGGFHPSRKKNMGGGVCPKLAGGGDYIHVEKKSWGGNFILVAKT